MTQGPHDNRDAGTGRFASDEEAAAHPETTIRETRTPTDRAAVLEAFAKIVGEAVDSWPSEAVVEAAVKVVAPALGLTADEVWGKVLGG